MMLFALIFGNRKEGRGLKCNMNRIMVMGVSAGVGKSTFAGDLGSLLDINVYHLNALYLETKLDKGISRRI